LPESSAGARDRFDEVHQRGQRLLDTLVSRGADVVIADSSITKEFARVVDALVDVGSERTRQEVLRLLALRHPDWLEPMGHALTRAFHGHVPTRIGFWSSIDKYLGSGGQRRRRQQPSNGHEILSLADEAASLPEAISAYLELLGSNKDSEAEDFEQLAQAFDTWRSDIKTILREQV
jgi:hypothetical protein